MGARAALGGFQDDCVAGDDRSGHGREEDDPLETLWIEVLTSLLRLLADRFESRHEVRDDLQDEQDREHGTAGTGAGEQGR